MPFMGSGSPPYIKFLYEKTTILSVVVMVRQASRQ